MSDPKYTTVAFVSANRFAVSNAAGDSFVPEFVPDLRVRADCQADGVRLGTVTAATHDAGSERTLVDLVVDAGASLTANLAAVLHGNDVPDSLCNHAGHHHIGGRDALPKATTDLSGLVKLATAPETKGGAVDDKAVTPAGLATAAKGLINAYTTIYVRTDGNDANDGTANDTAHAKLTIAGALASIAGKLIAGGVTVTIQVADGTYNISSVITIDHPDADKIQILGNVSAETIVAITAIDVAAKTITVAGDYTALIQSGDTLAITGSSTTNVNGAYIVSAVAFSGGNTIITCSAETFSSAVVGGGSIVIKPCNKCIMLCGSGVTFLSAIGAKIKNVYGFKIVSGGGTAYGVSAIPNAKVIIPGKTIIQGFNTGVWAHTQSCVSLTGVLLKNCNISVICENGSLLTAYSNCIFDSSITRSAQATNGSTIAMLANQTIHRNSPATPYSPAADTAGNGNGFIRTV